MSVGLNNAWTTGTAGGFSKWAVLGYGIGNGLGGAGVVVTSGTFKVAWLIPVGKTTPAIWLLQAAENNSPQHYNAFRVTEQRHAFDNPLVPVQRRIKFQSSACF